MTDRNLQEFARQSPGRRMAILHRLGMAHLAPKLKKLGISRGQIGFLLSVLQDEGVFQEELSARLFIDKAATARVLHDLEGRALIRREADEYDRRKKRIHPTKLCRDLQPELVAALHKHNETLLGGLTERERLQFLQTMDKMIANLRVALEEEL